MQVKNRENMLIVVGVGITRGHLTERGKKLIEDADIVYGSKKALDLVKDFIKGKKIVMSNFDDKTYAEIEKRAKNCKVVVLSTGDPMVSGLGTKLKADMIESGISSVSVALSRLKIDLCDVVVVSCHARKCSDEIVKALKLRPVLALISGSFNVDELVRRIGDENVKITVLEDLCKDTEKIYELKDAKCLNFSPNTLLYFELLSKVNKS